MAVTGLPDCSICSVTTKVESGIVIHMVAKDPLQTPVSIHEDVVQEICTLISYQPSVPAQWRGRHPPLIAPFFSGAALCCTGGRRCRGPLVPDLPLLAKATTLQLVRELGEDALPHAARWGCVLATGEDGQVAVAGLPDCIICNVTTKVIWV